MTRWREIATRPLRTGRGGSACLNGLGEWVETRDSEFGARLSRGGFREPKPEKIGPGKLVILAVLHQRVSNASLEILNQH
jgi:hypothetical protein